MAAATPNVWMQMNYVPPRGQCNFKASLVSAKCPCLRFMLHPLKSSSSFECDGCSHHASFHSMENKYEDEIRKRWEMEASEKQGQEDHSVTRPRKRLRELENSTENNAPVSGILGRLWPSVSQENTVIDENLAQTTSKGRSKARNGNVSRTRNSNPTRAAAARSRTRVVELPEDDYATMAAIDVD